MKEKAKINIQMLKSMYSNGREQETTASRETVRPQHAPEHGQH